MKSTNVSVLVSKMLVGNEEHITFRDLLIRICVRKKIYVKSLRGIQGNKHHYTIKIYYLKNK